MRRVHIVVQFDKAMVFQVGLIEWLSILFLLSIQGSYLLLTQGVSLDILTKTAKLRGSHGTYVARSQLLLNTADLSRSDQNSWRALRVVAHKR